MENLARGQKKFFQSPFSMDYSNLTKKKLISRKFFPHHAGCPYKNYLVIHEIHIKGMDLQSENVSQKFTL